MEAKEVKVNRIKTTRLVGQYLDIYLEELRRAPEEGKLLAYCNGAPMWFMLNAQDIVYAHGEGYGAFTAARHWAPGLQGVAEAEGVDPEICSYSRSHFGCGILAQRGIPPGFPHPEAVTAKPDLVCGIKGFCSTAMSWVIALQQLFDIPSFIIEVPYIWDLKDEEHHRATVVSNLKDFVAFLEKVSGHPYDWDALQEKLAVLKKAMTLRNEAFQLGDTHIPAPGTFFDWAVSLGPSTYLIGRPETVDFYAQLKAEVQERIAQNISAIPDEKYRILWDGLMFWPKVGELSRKFAAANCVVVGGSYTRLTFWPYPERIDPEHPLDTIADYLLGFGIANRDPAIYQDVIIQMCKDFSVDGALLSVPHTCRPNSLLLKMLGPRLQRELGMPVVEIEADSCDVNFYSESRTNYAVEGLLEAITSGKKR